MATFLKSGPRVAICPTCTVSVIGIKTAINTIEAIFVLKPISNEMPAIMMKMLQSLMVVVWNMIVMGSVVAL